VRRVAAARQRATIHDHVRDEPQLAVLRLRPAAPRQRTDSEPIAVRRLRRNRVRFRRTLRQCVGQIAGRIDRRDLAIGRSPEVFPWLMLQRVRPSDVLTARSAVAQLPRGDLIHKQCRAK